MVTYKTKIHGKSKIFGLLLATTLVLSTPWSHTANAATECTTVMGDSVCSDANADTTAISDSTSTSGVTIPSDQSSTASDLSSSSLIVTDADAASALLSAEIEEEIDLFSTTIDEIIDELDPEFETPLANALSAAVSSLGETFTEEIRQGRMSKEEAEEKLRAHLEALIGQANKVDDVAEAAATEDADKQALDEKMAQNLDSFAQGIYQFINQITKDPYGAVAADGTSASASKAAGNHNGTFPPKWDRIVPPSGKLSLFMGKGDYYGEGPKSDVIIDGDYVAEYARFETICRSKGDGKTYKIEHSIFQSMDIIAGLIEQQGYRDVRYALTSCYRSPSHNATVGGKPQSQHMEGTAMDLAAHAINEQNRLEEVPMALAFDASCLVMNERGSGGNGKYDGWIHVDTRNGRNVWFAGDKPGCLAQKPSGLMASETPVSKASATPANSKNAQPKVQKLPTAPLNVRPGVTDRQI